jgi:nucleoside-diphosphate-sugar epimerase
MKTLITGSAGHLGEALVRKFREAGRDAVGLDIQPSPFTDVVGSVADRDIVRACLRGVDTVLHAATLHKPHVGTHSKAQFVETNVSGTLCLLEEAVAAGVRAFVYTSTTSAFGAALNPPPDAPAAWITEAVMPVPRNIYGVTKVAAEDLCQLVHRETAMPCIVLRTSRFFPEEDDDEVVRDAFDQDNVKANEFLYRRVDIEDVVDAHLLAIERAAQLRFGRYIISATSPFSRDDLAELRRDAPAVLRRVVPEHEPIYRARHWRMAPSIDRVYVNERAREQLGWRPKYDFRAVLARLANGDALQSPLARLIGRKGYHRR